MFKYAISIKWSDEDEGFIATVPELEGLSAFGETQEEAVNELLVAEEAFIETLKAKGVILPEPAGAVRYSGQTRLRMPKTLHAKLAEEAEREGVSLNTYILSLLSGNYGVQKAVNAIRKDLNDTFTHWTYLMVQKSDVQAGYFETPRKGLQVVGSSLTQDLIIKQEVN